MKFHSLNILLTLVVTAMCQRICKYTTPKRYIGHFDHATGNSKIQPFQSNTTSNREICNKNCLLNDECYATSFDKIQSVCSFYNTSHFYVSNQGTIEYSQWVPCNMSEGRQPEDGRCRGLWVSYDDHFISIHEYQILEKLYGTEATCKEQCLQNPLCGFINFKDHLCILVPKWPYLNLNMTTTETWTLENWTCVDHFVDNLEIRKEESQPNKEKCTGYWTISNKNYSLRSSEAKWLNFQTQIYTECLEECNRHSNCFKAFYNVTYSLCVLYQIERSDGIRFPHNIIVIVFDWICVKNDSRRPAMNKDEKRYLSMGMNCYRIISTEDLYIGQDECGRYPPISRFVKCTGIHYENKWDITDSCLVNQSYWTFPTETILLGNMSGHEMWNVTKVFTGLQIYWLAHLTSHNLMIVDYLECRSFNASRPIEVLKSDEIVSRYDWQALPPGGEGFRYSKTPEIFDVVASQQPFYSCKTKAACTDILRWLQVLYFHGTTITEHFLDIPYNFMIDEDGNIYEVRGWKKQCAAVYPYNSRTICVGYIGWFKNSLPGERYLNSLKKLIAYALDQGYLVKDYSLFIQQDLVASSVQRNLVIVIKNWYRYRGFLQENCTNVSVLIISLNFVPFFVIMLLLRFFYGMLTFKECCDKCRFLYDNNVKLRQLVPTTLITEDVSQVHENDPYNNVIIYERSVCLFTGVHLKIVKLLKLWFFNNYSDCSNTGFVGNSINCYLNFISRTTKGVAVFDADIITNDGVELKQSKVIVCVSDTNTVSFLKGLLQNGSCICYYFKIEKIDITAMLLETKE